MAVEIPNVGGEPMAVDITNTAIAGYHFDNRNDDRRYPGRYDDDHYFEWLDRLHLQISWWRFQLGFRFDAATYFQTLGLADFQRKKDSGEVDFEPTAVQGDLRTRYVNTYYPAKLWVGYTQPGLDVTVGDFYAQLGRGLVFSARKVDELAIDTTVRGGKVVADHDFGSLRLGATVFAGQMNPLRIDEPSGRRLHADGSPLFFGFPGPGSVDDLVFTSVDTTTNTTYTVTEQSHASYLEDTVVGGRIEGGNQTVQLAANLSLLLRESYTEEFYDCLGNRLADTERVGTNEVRGACAKQFPEFTRSNATRLHDTIRTFSGSLSFPSISDHGDLYVEVAGQQLRDGHLERDPATQALVPDKDLSGYAIYAAASAKGGPVTVSLEGKHYRSFFTLSANLDTDPSASFNAAEFDAIAYSQPPTAEPTYTEPIGAPNVCITGGQGRVDYRFNPHVKAYAWVGHYVSLSELSDKNYECKRNNEGGVEDELRTNTWDTAAGTELDFERGKSHVKAWGGARHSELSVPYRGFITGEGEIFYSEGYLRYDFIKHLAGSFSLQLQGNTRRRYKPENFAGSWFEGQNSVALQWSPHISAIFGYEYTSQEGCQPGRTTGLCHYFKGTLQWRSASNDTVIEQIFDQVRLSVGQERGGLKCVSGVCRFFPPYEGARLELVSRF